MIKLEDRQISEYFRRSFASVDGLWFMKVEEKYGFDTALDIDREVWKVVPKIQARMLKAIGEKGNTLEDLFECLTTKFAIEGFEFRSEIIANGFEIILSRCPWHELRVKSKREHISGKVGDIICGAEYAVWASEFNAHIQFEQKSQICKGDECCVLKFSY